MNEQPIDREAYDLVSGPGRPVAATESSPAMMRQGLRDAIELFTRDAPAIEVQHVSDEVVPGRDGSIPVRVYRPETPTAVIVYLHGGAWSAGDLDTHDLATRRISRDTGAVVVSVDYRLAPEHAFPAPLDDALDALVWAGTVHPELAVLVAGDSAGGTLAACAALRARDEGGPRVDGQVLIYPAIDDDLDTPSMVAFAEGGHITRDDVRHYFDVYLAPQATRGSSYAMPGRATSLEGLPPAVVVIAGHDLLRSAEEDYSRRLQEAGVPVVVQIEHDLVHGWIDFATAVTAADRAFDRLSANIAELVDRVAGGAATPQSHPHVETNG